MKKTIMLVAIFVTSALAPTHAATEFIRFTGIASMGPCVICAVSLDDLGWTEGQPVYFDVMFDTALDSPLAADDFLRDYFAAVGLASTNASGLTFDGDDILGVTNTYAEGPVTWFSGFGLDLLLGSTFGALPDFGGDESIATWEVGKLIWLYRNETVSGHLNYVARLNVTYRGSTPPPPIPLPASVWLLLPALGVLRLLGRRRHGRKSD